MNEDALLPLLDDMLENRKIGIEKINKMFGLNIEVDFSSSWQKLRKDIEIAQEVEESNVTEEPEKPEQSNPDGEKGEENE